MTEFTPEELRMTPEEVSDKIHELLDKCIELLASIRKGGDYTPEYVMEVLIMTRLMAKLALELPSQDDVKSTTLATAIEQIEDAISSLGGIN